MSHSNVTKGSCLRVLAQANKFEQGVTQFTSVRRGETQH
jgi:hypothetical protein